MAEPPCLETERLRLEPFDEDRHLTERYVGWLNNADVVRFSEQRHRRHDIASCRAYWAGIREGGHFGWAIFARNHEPRHIGNITVLRDPPNRAADIGILLGETAAWGQGYGAEAWGEVCRFLLEKMSIRKITAGTMAVNQGMIGVCERCGMVEDGRRARHFLLDGKEVDLVQYALFAGGGPARP